MEYKLICSSGEVEVKDGDRFRHKDLDWEIVRAGSGMSYSPSGIGGCPNIACKPVEGEIPGYYQRYINVDGTIDFCGDSVAAFTLDTRDGKSRDARGYLLRAPGEAVRKT